MSYCIVFFQGTLLFFLVSCASHSLEDFHEEGEGVMRSLIQEMQFIQTREDLLEAKGRIQYLFERLVDIIIRTHEYRSLHVENDEIIPRTHEELNEKLRTQMNRIYYLEGGREIIEKCQENALYRLDFFEKRAIKANRSSPLL